MVKSVLDKFTDHVLEYVKNFKVGNGLDEGVHIGPVADEHQLRNIMD